MKSLRLQMAICWVLFASTASGQNLINPASSLRPSENPLSLESMPASPGIAIPEKLESKPSAQEQKDQTLGAIEQDGI